MRTYVRVRNPPNNRHSPPIRGESAGHREAVGLRADDGQLPPAESRRCPGRPRSHSAPVPDGPATSIPNTRGGSRLLALGVARVEIARRLGVSKATVSYHARRLGQPVDERCARRYDWSAVQRYYDAGHSVRECIEAFGFSSASWFEAVKRGAVLRAAEHDAAVRAPGRRHLPRALQPQAAPAARGRQAGTVRAVRRDGVVRPAADAGAAPRQRATRRQPPGEPRAAVPELPARHYAGRNGPHLPRSIDRGLRSTRGRSRGPAGR